MGTVYRKSVTRAIPDGARIAEQAGNRIAKWTDAKGKHRTAPVNANGRISVESATFIAKYRDGSGQTREVSTGCKSEAAARRVLADLERRSELVRSGVITAGEDSIADHAGTDIDDHFSAYLQHLESKQTSPTHRENIERCLKRIANGCGFTKLGDFNREKLERWLIARGKQPSISARTRNLDRAAIVAFCNWCILTNRLTINPFATIAKADEKSDQRRKRRAMTEAELIKLLDVTSRRPLVDAMTVRRGNRRGQVVANLKPEVIERLNLLGRERALIYKTLVLTGLRKRELASLTVGQLHLDGPHPFADLAAADEKNRQGSQIPLRADLADDLRSWLATKAGDSFGRLSADARLFNVPDKLIKILDRDLVMAGLATRKRLAGKKWKYDKRDERGRTLDVHALRHSFGTLLSAGGVSPRTAQAAMRHSSIDLTMNVYTDPKLLDVQSALDSLPGLPLASAGATDKNPVAPAVAPNVAPTLVQRDDFLANACKRAVDSAAGRGESTRDVKHCEFKHNDVDSTTCNVIQQVETSGIEPPTPSLQS